MGHHYFLSCLVKNNLFIFSLSTIVCRHEFVYQQIPYSFFAKLLITMCFLNVFPDVFILKLLLQGYIRPPANDKQCCPPCGKYKLQVWKNKPRPLWSVSYGVQPYHVMTRNRLNVFWSVSVEKEVVLSSRRQQKMFQITKWYVVQFDIKYIQTITLKNYWPVRVYLSSVSSRL